MLINNAHYIKVSNPFTFPNWQRKAGKSKKRGGEEINQTPYLWNNFGSLPIVVANKKKEKKKGNTVLSLYSSTWSHGVEQRAIVFESWTKKKKRKKKKRKRKKETWVRRSVRGRWNKVFTCKCGVVNGVVCRGNGRLAGDRCANGGGRGCRGVIWREGRVGRLCLCLGLGLSLSLLLKIIIPREQHQLQLIRVFHERACRN